jgi:hypothetical protein
VSDLSNNLLGSVASRTFGMAPWTRQLGTAGDDGGSGIAVDAAGNIVVAGSTNRNRTLLACAREERQPRIARHFGSCVLIFERCFSASSARRFSSR